MPETIKLRFNCGGCAKSYAWKPELSKKRVKCKCGSVMTVPDLTPQFADEPPALPDDDILTMVENAPAGASQGELLLAAAATAPPVKAKAKAVAKPAGGAAKNVLGYRTGPTQRQNDRAKLENIHDLKRDVYLPTGLIAGAFIAYYAWLAFHGASASAGTLASSGAAMAVLLLAKTVLMIAGAFVVAPMAGVSFGPLWTAILKLAALSIAPDVFATILEQSIGVPGAGLLVGALTLALYWALMSVLFDMEAAEAWYVIVLFGVLRWILTIVLSMVLLGLFLKGGVSAGGIGGGAAPPTASAAANDYDERIESMSENNLIEEGHAYIKRTGRQSGMTGTIDRLYAAGARDVSFALAKDINGHSEPLSLVVQWPRDAKKRVALLAAINEDMVLRAKAREQMHPDWGKQKPDVIPDDGGKYVELPIGG